MAAGHTNQELMIMVFGDIDGDLTRAMQELEESPEDAREYIRDAIRKLDGLRDSLCPRG